jgi:hypothetical protein
VHAILEEYCFLAAILEDGLDGIEIPCLAGFKAYRIVEHEAGILHRLDLFVDIGHSGVSVRHGLRSFKDNRYGSSQGETPCYLRRRRD